MLKYIKKAFTNPWNLLFFFGAMGIAALSGFGDVLVPVVLAGEAVYLGFLGTHPKFQKYVEAQEAKAGRQAVSQKSNEVLQRILQTIPRPLYDRYESLRQRCRELHQIATDLKSPGLQESPLTLESMQVEGLDRLLWVYLRLLFTQYSLERFFQTVTEERLATDLKRVEEQLSDLDSSDKFGHNDKIRRTLSDNLQTMQERMGNFHRAEANHQYVLLELDRLENKIKSLAEMSVNRQDPDFISSQVDAVADSMRETEKTMNDLQFVTGLGQVDEETPELLSAPLYITE